MYKVLKAAALFAILGWTATAQALPICVASVAASVGGTSACELGTINNDKLNPIQVNLDNIFGYNDWALDGKDDDLDGVEEGPNSLGLSLIGDTISGTWSIAANTFSDIMLVFKGGANNTNPDVYVAYLLSSISGSYQSPFTNPDRELKDISHVSIYVRGDGGNQVPEPGTLALLGIGLFGMGLARRRLKV